MLLGVKEVKVLQHLAETAFARHCVRVVPLARERGDMQAVIETRAACAGKLGRRPARAQPA